MLAEMSSAQLAGWMAYAELEPFGEWTTDHRMAILTAYTAMAHLKKADGGPWSIDDFRLHKRPAPTVDSKAARDALRRKIDAWFSSRFGK